jgi:acyl carrier protein
VDHSVTHFKPPLDMPIHDNQAPLLDLMRCELHINTDAVHADTPLSQLATDSLEWVELLTAVEDRFDVTISDPQSQALHTFGDLLHLLEQPVAARA